MAFGGLRDITSSPFSVGDEVMVRCTVNSITGTQGAGARVTVTVDTPGNAGEVQGVTFTVSPIQCRRAQGAIQSSNLS